MVLNFTAPFGAVLVAVKMFLTGRSLAHANDEQCHKAGGRHNKLGKHAALTTVATT